MSLFQLRLLVLSDGLDGCKGRPMLLDLILKLSSCLPQQTSLRNSRCFNIPYPAGRRGRRRQGVGKEQPRRIHKNRLRILESSWLNEEGLANLLIEHVVVLRYV